MRTQLKLFTVITITLTYVVGYTFVDVIAIEHRMESDRLIVASKADLFHAAKTILDLQGFKFQKLDETSGTLSTNDSPMRLVVDECECGSSLGPLEDMRPILRISIDIRVKENSVSIKATIHGDYPKNQVTEEMIETDFLDQISRYIE